MADQFDEQANTVALTVIETIIPREGVDAPTAFGAIRKAIASALRETDRAAEIRTLQWVMTAEFVPNHLLSAILIRIDKLKKGGG